MIYSPKDRLMILQKRVEVDQFSNKRPFRVPLFEKGATHADEVKLQYGLGPSSGTISTALVRTHAESLKLT